MRRMQEELESYSPWGVERSESGHQHDDFQDVAGADEAKEELETIDS